MNEKNYDDKYPLVSVIVPVRNGEKTIGKLLAALQKQDYPHNNIQIIIVNNGSQDNTIGIIKKYPVILEHEKEKAGSYAARNKGILVASGEVIAFTDVDCIPEKSWINAGVRALYKERADIAGGRINFTFSARKSAAECFDSLNSLRNDRFIYNKLGAITANLFVRKVLFDKIGLFPEVHSGGDINWTGKALAEGFSLIYIPEAIVYHPTRNFVEVLRKSWFRGTGILLTIKQRRWWFFKTLYLITRLLTPVPSRIILKSFVADRRHPEIKGRLLAVWGISYLCQLSMFAGLVSSVFGLDLKIFGKD